MLIPVHFFRNIARRHWTFLPFMGLRAILDPLLCVLVCRGNLNDAQTPQTHTEPNADQTSVWTLLSSVLGSEFAISIIVLYFEAHSKQNKDVYWSVQYISNKTCMHTCASLDSSEQQKYKCLGGRFACFEGLCCPVDSHLLSLLYWCSSMFEIQQNACVWAGIVPFSSLAFLWGFYDAFYFIFFIFSCQKWSAQRVCIYRQ